MYEQLYHPCLSLVAPLCSIISTGVNSIISETLHWSGLTGHSSTSRCAVVLTKLASHSPLRVILMATLYSHRSSCHHFVTVYLGFHSFENEAHQKGHLDLWEGH